MIGNDYKGRVSDIRFILLYEERSRAHPKFEIIVRIDDRPQLRSKPKDIKFGTTFQPLLEGSGSFQRPSP